MRWGFRKYTAIHGRARTPPRAGRKARGVSSVLIF